MKEFMDNFIEAIKANRNELELGIASVVGGVVFKSLVTASHATYETEVTAGGKTISGGKTKTK